MLAGIKAFLQKQQAASPEQEDAKLLDKRHSRRRGGRISRSFGDAVVAVSPVLHLVERGGAVAVRDADVAQRALHAHRLHAGRDRGRRRLFRAADRGERRVDRGDRGPRGDRGARRSGDRAAGGAVRGDGEPVRRLRGVRGRAREDESAAARLRGERRAAPMGERETRGKSGI